MQTLKITTKQIHNFYINNTKQIKAAILFICYFICILSLGTSAVFTAITLMDFSFMSIEEKLMHAAMGAYTSWVAISLYFYLKYK